MIKLGLICAIGAPVAFFLGILYCALFHHARGWPGWICHKPFITLGFLVAVFVAGITLIVAHFIGQ